MNDLTKYGLTIHTHDFSQKQFEAYQLAVIRASRDAYFSFGDVTGVTASAHVDGETAREAVRNNIISGVTIDMIDMAKPYVVKWVADLVRQHIKQITTAPVDPN